MAIILILVHFRLVKCKFSNYTANMHNHTNSLCTLTIVPTLENQLTGQQSHVRFFFFTSGKISGKVLRDTVSEERETKAEGKL